MQKLVARVAKGTKTKSRQMAGFLMLCKSSIKQFQHLHLHPSACWQFLQLLL